MGRATCGSPYSREIESRFGRRIISKIFTINDLEETRAGRERGDGAGAAASSDAISHAFFFASALAMLFW